MAAMAKEELLLLSWQLSPQSKEAVRFVVDSIENV
jgi:hypothetical protein